MVKLERSAGYLDLRFVCVIHMIPDLYSYCARVNPVGFLCFICHVLLSAILGNCMSKTGECNLACLCMQLFQNCRGGKACESSETGRTALLQQQPRSK